MEHTLAIVEQGIEVSHLALELHEPEGPLPTALCVVFLHGFGSDQKGEKVQSFRRRATDARVPFCSFDFQGHGRSGGSMRGLTLSRNLQDLGRVLDYLRYRGHDRFALLGSSMGALTGMWYAALHPPEVAVGLHIAPALAMGEGFRAWAGKEGIERWHRDGFIRYESELVSCELGWKLMEDLASYDMSRLLALHRTPSLLIQGMNDDLVPWRTVADFVARSHREELELHLVGDGDHRLTDYKGRLWTLFLEFLAGRGFLPTSSG